MSLISVILILIAIGLAAWAVQRFIPMEPVIKNIVMLLFVVVAIVVLLRAANVIGPVVLK